MAPRYRFYRHCEVLIAVLQRVADGALKRVIIEEPPRHGKSETLSRLFAAYWLYRFPEQWVGLTSYAAELANTLSRNARDNYCAVGRELKDDAGAVKHWETGAGGGLWAAGVGGPITGKGFHLGIIDDPIKNAEESESDVVARRNQDWYRSTFYTRAEPGAAIVVMQTRWPGVADFIGWLLTEEGGDEPEAWHIVSFAAEREDGAKEIPKTCTLEPDWRAPGDALCPERYPLDRLRKLASRLGPYYYAALFQQRPVPREGVMFPRDRVQIVDAMPVGVRRVRYWDKAGTEGGGAYTAGVRMAIDEHEIVYVEDVQRAQLAAHRRRELMRQTAELDGGFVEQFVEQEPGSGGKDSASDDVRNLAGFPITAETASGDKVVRARPFAAQWQAGNVRLLRGDWNAEYLAEMEHFPHGKFKDQTDASSGAYNRLNGGGFWIL